MSPPRNYCTAGTAWTMSTVQETYQKLPKGQGTEKTPFDYFHINSITLSPDGELLISGRNTWALYKVGRTSGEVVWRMNGKKSDFEMGAGSHFYWQHTARYNGPTKITLFDDGASPAEEAQSRAIILSVDESKMKVSLEKSFVHPARLLAPNQGSVQVLEDGGTLVGWGAQPYFSRFSADGELVLDARFPTNIESYRAFSARFASQPTDRPAVAIGADPVGGKIVYVSWNGSTEVAAWEVLGGPAGQLTPLALADWVGLRNSHIGQQQRAAFPGDRPGRGGQQDRELRGPGRVKRAEGDKPLHAPAARSPVRTVRTAPYDPARSASGELGRQTGHEGASLAGRCWPV